jgi:hypothetical protein
LVWGSWVVLASGVFYGDSSSFTWVTQIDSYFQALPVPPSTHVIIEPHPDVLKYMREQGWYDKKGVIILEGKWQDFVDSKILDDVVFDVVYTDTFSEEYEGVVGSSDIYRHA